MPKTIQNKFTNNRARFVGDGYSVRTLFSYGGQADQINPFLQMELIGPQMVDAGPQMTIQPQPRRGFDIVTWLWDGDQEIFDISGQSVQISAGDLAVARAGKGLVLGQRQTKGFALTGGPLRMAELWINKPAQAKSADGNIVAVSATAIPSTSLLEGAVLHVIAGKVADMSGPLDLPDVTLLEVRAEPEIWVELPVAANQTTILAVLAGHIRLGDDNIFEGEAVQLSEGETTVRYCSDSRTIVVIMQAPKLQEPMVGYGPYVLSTEDEVQEAVAEFKAGQMGR